MRNALMVLMEAVPQELDTDNVIEAKNLFPTLSMFMSFIYGELQQINILLSAHVVLDSRSSIDAFWL